MIYFHMFEDSLGYSATDLRRMSPRRLATSSCKTIRGLLSGYGRKIHGRMIRATIRGEMMMVMMVSSCIVLK